MPAVHIAAPVTVPHVEPIGPPTGAQLEPVQQTLGAGAGWAVHVRPGAHAPVVSQKQPCVPTMHVDFAPMPPPPEPEDPEDPALLPELDVTPELLADPPDASSCAPKVLELEPPPPIPDEIPDEDEPPQAPIAAISETVPKIIIRPAFHVRFVMTSPHLASERVQSRRARTPRNPPMYHRNGLILIQGTTRAA
jgi:hypothetical protein